MPPTYSEKEPEMPDTRTFGRYAELPYEQMRPEQQSRRGFRTARSRHSAIYAMRPLAGSGRF